MQFLTLPKIHALQLRALQSGARPLTPVYPWSKSALPSRVEWNIAGDCLSPVERVVVGRTETKGRGLHVSVGASVYLSVKCRRCENCERKRAAHWRFRAVNEVAQAERTWFATFTMSPLEHGRAPMRYRQQYARKFPSEPPLATAAGMEERVADFGRQLTLYFKRLRKATGVRLRYLLVAESHKNGLPHFHALIHELAGEPLLYRQLVAEWHLGFSSFKLVEEGYKAARYVAKYISKASTRTRMRCSLAYGRLRPGRPTAQGSEATVGDREGATQSLYGLGGYSQFLSSAKLSNTKPKRSILWQAIMRTNQASGSRLGSRLTFTTTLAGETLPDGQSISDPLTIRGDDMDRHPSKSGGIIPSQVRDGTPKIECPLESEAIPISTRLVEGTSAKFSAPLARRKRGRIC